MGALPLLREKGWRMSRYARRTDNTQAEIVETLRGWGYVVHITSHIGNGIPDAIMCDGRRCEWLEIKSSMGDGLTDAEAKFYDICPGGPPIIAWTADLAAGGTAARQPAQGDDYNSHDLPGV